MKKLGLLFLLFFSPSSLSIVDGQYFLSKQLEKCFSSNEKFNEEKFDACTKQERKDYPNKWFYEDGLATKVSSEYSLEQTKNKFSVMTLLTGKNKGVAFANSHCSSICEMSLQFDDNPPISGNATVVDIKSNKFVLFPDRAAKEIIETIKNSSILNVEFINEKGETNKYKFRG